MKNYYNILGVDKAASKEDIKKAYYKLAHKHHPDKGGDGEEFKKINEAYQVLSSKEKRAQYDRFGRTFEDGEGVGGEGFDPSGFGFANQAGFGNAFEFDLGDIFGNVFEGARMARDMRKGADIKIDIEIPLEMILSGQTKKIGLAKFVTCLRCHGNGAEPETSVKECFTCGGTGYAEEVRRTFFGSIGQKTICPACGGEGNVPDDFCNVCKGEGRVKKKEDLKISIPAGVAHEQILKMPGAGNAGKRGHRSGDLYIRTLIMPHPIFKRKGNDIFVFKKISFSKAVLGGKVEVPTLEGKNVLLKVPKGMASGEIFRLRQKGIPHFLGIGRGDAYVELEVDVPTRLSSKQKDLLNKLEKEGL